MSSVFVTIQANEANRQIQAFTRLYIRRMWARKWFGMFRHNIFACVKDTRRVIRKPRERQTGTEASRSPALGSNIYQDGRHPGGPHRNTGLPPPPKQCAQKMEVGTTDRRRALEAAPEKKKHSDSRLDPSLLPRRRYVRVAPGSDYSSENTVSSEFTSVKVEDGSNVPKSTQDENIHIRVPEVLRGIFPEAVPANDDQDSVNSLEATVEVQELPENQLVPIYLAPGGEPLLKVTLSPDSSIVKEKHELFVSGASGSDDFLKSETTEGLSINAELPNRSILVTQDVSLLPGTSEGTVMSTDLPRRRVFNGDQHFDKKLRPAVHLIKKTDRTSTGKRASAVPKKSAAFKGYSWSLRGFARPTAEDCPHRTAGFNPQPDVCGKGDDVMNPNLDVS